MSCKTLHPELTMLAVSDQEVQTLGGTGTGLFTDGVLTVSVSSFNGSTFSWKSNISIDCIFAQTADGGKFVTYDLESLGEDDLAFNAAITRISFCYDVASEGTPTPAPTTTPSPTESMPDTSLSRTDPTNRTDNGALLLGLLIVGLLSAGLMAGGTFRRRRPRASRALATDLWSTQSAQGTSVANSWSLSSRMTDSSHEWGQR